MNRPIIMPRIYKRRTTNRQEQLGGELGYPDDTANSTFATSKFLKGNFVVLTSGILKPVQTDGIVALGHSADESKHDTTVNPPSALFGNRHWPFHLRGMQFLINVANDANAVGEANSAAQLSAVTLGSSYGLTRPTSGTYAGYQLLNSQETSLTLFTVVEIPTVIDGEKQDTNTYNGLVVVEVIESKQQILN